ncbi:MAG: hypothetical protein AAF063_32290 [Cyanobacteria bacterium J06643_5]
MCFEKYLEVLETNLFRIKGQKLTLVEREILKAAWESYSYTQVADNSYLTVGHIKDIASKLWKNLSEILGEKVTKANLRLVLEKKNLSLLIPTPPGKF